MPECILFLLLFVKIEQNLLANKFHNFPIVVFHKNSSHVSPHPVMKPNPPGLTLSSGSLAGAIFGPPMSLWEWMSAMSFGKAPGPTS